MKASVEYGLKAVLYLADRGGLVSSREIAKNMSIPRDYLIQLAQLLRNAGIVEARPGKHGGYRLAKAPSEVTLFAVLAALNDAPAVTVEYDDIAELGDAVEASNREEGESVNSVRKACLLAQECFDAYLDGITLEALLECSKNGDSAREYLSACLRAAGERLLD